MSKEAQNKPTELTVAPENSAIVMPAATAGIYRKLREPFHVSFVNWKINSYNSDKTKALITFHIDARAVQHRLNEVLGIENWGFTYSELEKDSGVHGKLKIRIHNPETDDITETVKEDVGYATSSSKNEWYKDAVSDALKRCAVHIGIGQFLYALPNHWIELNQPGQKYLTKEQDLSIKKWVTKYVKLFAEKINTNIPDQTGGGEVSAEEVDQGQIAHESPSQPAQKVEPKTVDSTEVDPDDIPDDFEGIEGETLPGVGTVIEVGGDTWTFFEGKKKTGEVFYKLVSKTRKDEKNPKYALSIPDWESEFDDLIAEWRLAQKKGGE